jgi:hypothetical protein
MSKLFGWILDWWRLRREIRMRAELEKEEREREAWERRPGERRFDDNSGPMP